MSRLSLAVATLAFFVLTMTGAEVERPAVEGVLPVGSDGKPLHVIAN